MNKTRTLAGWLLMLALCAMPVAGCQNFPRTRPETEKESSRRADDAATDKSAKPRGTGRAPIRSTGLDDRSREIERNLGAR